MSEFDRITVLIEARTAGLRDELARVDRQLAGLRARIGESFKSAPIDQMNSSLGRLRQSADATGRALNAMGAALAGLAIGTGARAVMQMADTWTRLDGRLKLVTASSSQLADVQAKLFSLSQATRSSFESTVDLYTRVARNAADLGLNQQRLLDLTETVNKAIQVGGSMAHEASAGVVQFGQALASGVLRGDEFRSIMENMPGLARALAQGLDVPIGRLRAMAEAGELTADKVVAAVLKMKGSIDADFSQLPVTMAQSLTQLSNATLKWVGETDKAVGASSALAAGISKVADNLDSAIPILVGLTGAVAAARLAFLAFNGAMLANPITATIAGVAALASGLVLLATSTADAQRAATAHYDAIQRFSSASAGYNDALKSGNELLIRRAELERKAANEALNRARTEAQEKLKPMMAEIERVQAAIAKATEGSVMQRTLQSGLDTQMEVVRGLRKVVIDASVALGDYGDMSDGARVGTEGLNAALERGTGIARAFGAAIGGLNSPLKTAQAAAQDLQRQLNAAAGGAGALAVERAWQQARDEVLKYAAEWEKANQGQKLSAEVVVKMTDDLQSQILKVRDLDGQIKAIEQSWTKTGAAIEKAVAPLDRDRAALNEATDQIRAETEGINRLADAYLVSAQAVQQANVANEAADQLRGKVVDGLEAETAALRAQIAAREQANARLQVTQGIRELADSIPLLQAELALVGATNTEREVQLGLLQAKQIIQLAGNRLTQDEIDLFLKLTEQAARLRGELQDAAEARELWLEPVKNAIKGIQDALAGSFRRILDGEIDDWRDFGKKILDIMKEVAAQIAALMVFRPVVGGLLGAVGASPGFINSIVPGFVGSTAGTAGGGILDTIGSGLSAVGGWLGIGGGGAAAASQAAVLADFGIVGAATSTGASAMGGGGMLAALGGAMPYIGAGLAAAAIVAPMLFKKKPSVGPGQAATLQQGALDLEVLRAAADNGGSVSTAAQYARSAISGFEDLFDAIGGGRFVTGTGFNIGNNQKEGFSYALYAPGQVAGSYNNTVEAKNLSSAEEAITQAFLAAVNAGLVEGLSDNFKAAFAAVAPETTEALQDIVARVAQYEEAIKPALDMLDPANSGLGQALQASADAFDALIESAAELGLAIDPLAAKAAEAAQAIRDGFVAGLETQAREATGKGFLNSLLGVVSETDARALSNAAGFANDPAKLASNQGLINQIFAGGVEDVLSGLNLEQLGDVIAFFGEQTDSTAVYITALAESLQDVALASQEAAEALEIQAARQAAADQANTIQDARRGIREAMGGSVDPLGAREQLERVIPLDRIDAVMNVLGFQLEALIQSADQGSAAFFDFDRVLATLDANAGALALTDQELAGIIGIVNEAASQQVDAEKELAAAAKATADALAKAAEEAQALTDAINAAFTDLSFGIAERLLGEGDIGGGAALGLRQALGMTTTGDVPAALQPIFDAVSAIANAPNITEAENNLIAFNAVLQAIGLNDPDQIAAVGQVALATFDGVKNALQDVAEVAPDAAEAIDELALAIQGLQQSRFSNLNSTIGRFPLSGILGAIVSGPILDNLLPSFESFLGQAQSGQGYIATFANLSTQIEAMAASLDAGKVQALTGLLNEIFQLGESTAAKAQQDLAAAVDANTRASEQLAEEMARNAEVRQDIMLQLKIDHLKALGRDLEAQLVAFDAETADLREQLKGAGGSKDQLQYLDEVRALMRANLIAGGDTAGGGITDFSPSAANDFVTTVAASKFLREAGINEVGDRMRDIRGISRSTSGPLSIDPYALLTPGAADAGSGMARTIEEIMGAMPITAMTIDQFKTQIGRVETPLIAMRDLLMKISTDAAAGASSLAMIVKAINDNLPPVRVGNPNEAIRRTLDGGASWRSTTEEHWPGKVSSPLDAAHGRPENDTRATSYRGEMAQLTRRVAGGIEGLRLDLKVAPPSVVGYAKRGRR